MTPARLGKVRLIQPFDAWAGSQRVVTQLHEAFQALDLTCEVHLGFGAHGFVSSLSRVARFLPIDHIPTRKVLYALWLIAFWPRATLAAWRREILWANTVHAVPAVLPALWLAPSQVVLHVHEIEFPRLFHCLIAWAQRRGATVLCVSATQRKAVGLPADVLLNCVQVRSDAPPRQPPQLLFVGALSALKGFPLFLAVLRRLQGAGVQAVACVPAVPATLQAQRWAQEAAELGVDLRCGVSDPLQIYPGASLLLQCTDPGLWTETFSLVMAEALACGVPVGTAGMAVAQEVLGEAWALDVPSRDPQALADAVRALLSDPHRHAALQAAARRQRERYTFEAFRDRVRDVLAKISERQT